MCVMHSNIIDEEVSNILLKSIWQPQPATSIPKLLSYHSCYGSHMSTYMSFSSPKKTPHNPISKFLVISTFTSVFYHTYFPSPWQHHNDIILNVVLPWIQMYLRTCCWDVVPWGLQDRIVYGNTTGHPLEGERRERGGRQEGERREGERRERGGREKEEANSVTGSSSCHPTDSNNVYKTITIISENRPTLENKPTPLFAKDAFLLKYTYPPLCGAT